MFARNMLFAAFISQTRSTDLNILHESIMDEVRSIEFHRDHDFCVVKHLDSITDILAMADAMGSIERRASVMIAFSDFVKAIVSTSPVSEILTFCEVLGFGVNEFHRVEIDSDIILDHVIVQIAHALTLSSRFELLSIPGFMEPERQAAYRELIKIVFVDSRVRFRNLLKLQLDMSVTLRIVGLVNTMLFKRDHYQLQYPDLAFEYPPIGVLSDIIGLSPNQSYLESRMDVLASNLDLSDI